MSLISWVKNVNIKASEKEKDPEVLGDNVVEAIRGCNILEIEDR